MSLGTVNVQVNPPVAEVVCDVQVWVAIVPPAIVIEPIVVLTENPVPVTVTEVPTAPVVGLSTIAGVVTVKPAQVTTDDPAYVMTK